MDREELYRSLCISYTSSTTEQLSQLNEKCTLLTTHVYGDGGVEGLSEVGIGSPAGDDPVQVLTAEVGQG